MLRNTGHPDEARTAHQRAIAIQERLARDHPEIPDFASGLGASLHTLALIDGVASRFADAREQLLGAISWQKTSVGYQSLALSVHQFHEPRPGRRGAEGQRRMPSTGPACPRRQAVRRRGQVRGRGARFQPQTCRAGDRQAHHPYNAACVTARTADGQRADRLAMWETWSKLQEADPPTIRETIATTLRHWQQDADLASVRESESLARLPEAERFGMALPTGFVGFSHMDLDVPINPPGS